MEATSSSKENVLCIIELLLKIESSLACWPNADGLTALHLAASFAPGYCIPIIKTMLASCPEAAVVQVQRSQHTILHLLTNHQVASYEQGLELLQIPQLRSLINNKDQQGDTPLHLAARNRDLTMVRVLLEFIPKLGLRNKSGVSGRSLVGQVEQGEGDGRMEITETAVEHRRKLTTKEFEAAKRGDIAFLNEQLVSLGMDFLVSETPTGGNILHLLMQSNFNEHMIYEAIDFIRQAIHILPSLINQQDGNGNTLVHLMSNKIFSSRSQSLIGDLFARIRHDDSCFYYHNTSCSLKNDKGDTPLHVAIRDRNYGLAIQLLEVNLRVAGYVNNRNQTPLHLLSPQFDDDEVDRLISLLIEGNANLHYMQDEDGLTPLLTAVRERNLHMIRKLHQQFPDCREITDFKGRTLWHLFGSRRIERDLSSAGDFDGLTAETWKFLLDKDVGGHIRRLMASKDNDGTTPLHLAIENRNFDFALFFLDNWRDDDWSVKDKYDALLAIENKDGVSSYNLIASADHLPPQFEKSLFKNGNLLYGHRSLYGVPTTKIEEYSNTIGVIAALLATITFTAAFTVPGGLDSSKGTPLLLGKAAFQVFMVADVVGMCTSVMVLFCLLWIMTTGHKKESLLLLDVSVFLLQTSFHATLVTFMTGLYVTTLPIVPAIAISTCVVCTLLIILMHKGLVMLTVVPFFGRLIILGRKIR